MLLEALKTENKNCLYIESRKYHRRDAVMGDTLILWCNTTQSSGVKWSRNTSDGHFSYVFVNGSIKGDHNTLLQFSVVSSTRGEYSLRIYNVHPADNGWYDCYESNGRRIIGYHLVATSTYLNILEKRQYEYTVTSALIITVQHINACTVVKYGKRQPEFTFIHNILISTIRISDISNSVIDITI